MLSDASSTSPQYRVPRACPLSLPADRSDEQALTLSRQAQCEPCATCGQSGGSSSASLVYGHGCAQECSVLLCPVGTIFDFTRAAPRRPMTDQCVTCLDLTDTRLCSISDLQRLNIMFTDISGLTPLITMRNCRERTIDGTAGDITYGSCDRVRSDACTSPEPCPGLDHMCSDSPPATHLASHRTHMERRILSRHRTSRCRFLMFWQRLLRRSQNRNQRDSLHSPCTARLSLRYCICQQDRLYTRPPHLLRTYQESTLLHMADRF